MNVHAYTQVERMGCMLNNEYYILFMLIYNMAVYTRYLHTRIKLERASWCTKRRSSFHHSGSHTCGTFSEEEPHKNGTDNQYNCNDNESQYDSPSDSPNRCHFTLTRKYVTKNIRNYFKLLQH